MTQIPAFADEPGQPPAGHDVLRPGDELERARMAYVGGHAAKASSITLRLVRRLADMPGTEATEVLGSAHTLLGLARRMRGETPEECFAQAVRVFERLPADRLGSIGATMADYGIALQETGEHARAVVALDRALELGQDTPDVRRYRAAARRDRSAPGDRDAAYRLLEEAVRRAPGDWQAWGWLAELTEVASADPAAAARRWAQAWRILDEAGTFGRALGYRERAAAGYRGAVAARPDDAGLLIEAAQALAETGFGAEAADLLSQVAELPVGVEARLDAAELLIDIGESQFAADLANDVLAEDPGSGRATVILATALFRRDDVKSVEQARRKLTDFLRTRPSGSADAEILLGEVCHRSGDLEEALAHFDTALAIGKLDDARAASLYAGRGRLLLHLRHTADGVADLRRAAALRPRDAAIRFYLADAYRMTADRAAEIAQLQEVVDWTPGRGRENWVEAASRLGTALLENGEQEKALATLRRIPDPEALATDVLRPLTSALLEGGREKEALDALVDAECRSHRDLNILALHARVLYQLRRLKQAKELLTEVLAADATRWRDRAWLGEVHRLVGEPAEALRQLDQVLHDHPGNPFSLSSRAAVHLSRNDPARAETDLKRCLTSDPTDPFALQVLRDLLMQRRDYAALVGRYSRAARSAGAARAPALWRGYGSTLWLLAARAQAADILVQTERELKDDLAKDPCDAARLRALSDLLVAQGRIHQAIDRWQRAVDTPVGKSDARLWCEYGEVLRRAFRYRDAQEALDTALWLADEGYTLHVYHAMGRLMLDQSRYEEAIDFLDRAYRDPRDPAAWYDGCVARILADRITEVANRLHGWSRGHPDDAEARWLLGWLYYHTGAYAEAAEQAGRAVDHDPLDGRKQELLGWSLLRAAADLEGARRAFERALELEPALYSSWEGRIRVLLRSGRSGEADAQCEELLAATDGSGEREAVAPNVRGLCLAQLGKPLRAVAEFRKALPESGADRGLIEFSIAFCLLQAGHDEDAGNAMEQAWTDLEACGRPDEDDRGLQRRGVLTEVLQDMPDSVPPGQARSGGELLELTRRAIADELRRLPTAAAITMDDSV
jgi:tetratricopeptide (TPR) repeat protein